MTGRARLRIGFVARYLAGHLVLGGWLAAAALSTLVLDVPLHARPAWPGSSLSPAMQVPSLLPIRESKEPAPPPASPPKEKLIELAPWEQVPA